MATQRDGRRIALSLPETIEDLDEFRFLVDGKMFVWLWRERVAPKRSARTESTATTPFSCAFR